MNILVTGANGFIGKHLCHALSKQNVDVLAISRTSSDKHLSNVTYTKKNLSEKTDWAVELKNIDVVIHLAGRAHAMKDAPEESYKAYAKINIDATKHLAEQAAKQGVKRFIFLSSVKVNGESTLNPFTESDSPAPEDDYGKTKHEAEMALRKITQNTEMDFVIIRPPLVYGPNVKANFKNLVNLCKLSIPLPFGAITNKRSLIYVGNLISFIQTCTTHKSAANQTFLISDGQDISTTSLIKHIKQALNKRYFLIPIPQSWLTKLLGLAGKKSLSDRLFGNLQVNSSKASTLLNWKPKFSVQEGIIKTVEDMNHG